MKPAVPTLKTGQVIEIFTEPAAQIGPQGPAELVEFRYNLGDGYSRWSVHFLGDPPEMINDRTVYGHQEEGEPG